MFLCVAFPLPPFLFDVCGHAEHLNVKFSLRLILIYSNMGALYLHKDIPL